MSFGPFQLGGLAPGALEEVPAKVLAEQLGTRSGSAPRAAAADASARLTASFWRVLIEGRLRQAVRNPSSYAQFVSV